MGHEGVRITVGVCPTCRAGGLDKLGTLGLRSHEAVFNVY